MTPADASTLPRPRPAQAEWLVIVGAGFLPGAVLGVQLGVLLFFLNPDLPFEPRPILRATTLYGGILGAVSLVVHLPLTWRRPDRARGILPWALSFGFALAGLAGWVHASYFAYYLPSGINNRLIKAALWLSLLAIISFYTALLHSMHRRRFGIRGKIGIAVLILFSIFFVLERRQAFHPRPEIAPRPSTVEPAQRPHLLVVGLEGATLDAILPLAEREQLPFFSTLLQQGAHGRLTTLAPTRHSAVWTSLSTGKYPHRHGVLGERSFGSGFLVPGSELRLIPIGIGFDRWGTLGRPLPDPPGAQRQALTLWEILAGLGVRTAMIGWPATAPVPSDLVSAYSDRFFWGYAGPAQAQPSGAALRARQIRRRTVGLDRTQMARFGEAAPVVVGQLLAQDRWRQALAAAFLLPAPAPASTDDGPRELTLDSSETAMEPIETDADALFVVLPGLRSVSESYFGGYAAVQFDGLTQPRYQAANQIVSAYYAAVDAMLEQLWARLPAPRLLVVVSAYGVQAPEGLTRLWNGIARRGSIEGDASTAPDGVLLLYGDGIEAGAFLTRAQLTDVVPTLLYGLGFPVARDFDGQVLTDAFGSPFLARNTLTFVPSYEGLRR